MSFIRLFGRRFFPRGARNPVPTLANTAPMVKPVSQQVDSPEEIIKSDELNFAGDHYILDRQQMKAETIRR